MSDETKQPDDEYAAANFAHFDHRSSFSDVEYHVRSWPAWFVSGDDKIIAPVVRFYVADDKGRLIFERNTVVTALLDLTFELSEVMKSQAVFLSAMEGYRLVLPRDKDAHLRAISLIRQNLEHVERVLGEFEFARPEDSQEGERGAASERKEDVGSA